MRWSSRAAEAARPRCRGKGTGARPMLNKSAHGSRSSGGICCLDLPLLAKCVGACAGVAASRRQMAFHGVRGLGITSFDLPSQPRQQPQPPRPTARGYSQQLTSCRRAIESTLGCSMRLEEPRLGAGLAVAAAPAVAGSEPLESSARGASEARRSAGPRPGLRATPPSRDPRKLLAYRSNRLA